MGKFMFQISLNKSEYQCIIAALEMARETALGQSRVAQDIEISELLARMRRERRAM